MVPLFFSKFSVPGGFSEVFQRFSVDIFRIFSMLNSKSKSNCKYTDSVSGSFERILCVLLRFSRRYTVLRTFSLFLFFTTQLQLKSLTTQMGNSSTAVKIKIDPHISKIDPKLIIYKVVPVKIRFAQKTSTNLKDPHTGMLA